MCDKKCRLMYDECSVVGRIWTETAGPDSDGDPRLVSRQPSYLCCAFGANCSILFNLLVVKYQKRDCTNIVYVLISYDFDV